MRIELTREIETKFRTSLGEAGKREIGGMLLAEQLKPSHFCIVDFSLDSFSGSHMAFRRDPQSHQNTLGEFFRRTAEISNVLIILANDTPTRLFQFDLARKISAP
jgi:hypothetical protein